MASLPRPSRPSQGPPTGPLPSLPTPKIRTASSATSSPRIDTGAFPTPSGLPQSSSRAVSSSGIPTSRSTSTTTSPASSTPNSAAPTTPLPSLPPGSKTIRKVPSYNVFPKPTSTPSSRPTSTHSNSSSSTPTPRSSAHASTMPSAAPSRSLSNSLRTAASVVSAPAARESARSAPATPAPGGARDRDTVTDEDFTRGRQSTGGPKDKGNVIISVRVRPETGAPDGSAATGEWMVDGRQSLVSYRGREGGEYLYDNVFTTHDKNAKVYDAGAKRLVRRVMEGYHGTVFAYGMTGTGKTFSMQGTATSPGVIPLAITDIFSFIRETPQREFLLRVSYLEIYNEKIHDLLSAPISSNGQPALQQQEEIKLREDSRRGVYASPLKEEIVQSPTQLLRVIARGDQARRTSSTQYNARSSRSHAVVQIVVESRERNTGGAAAAGDKRSAIVPGGVRVSTLSLIDLAGSERAAENKERRTEGAHINKSLLTLGTVISRLSGNKDKSGQPTDTDGKHLPYRDSKLTRLLQGALSGNSLISILCTIQIGSQGSAAAQGNHTGETLNTLKFAARARNNIISHAKKAEEAHANMGDAGSRALLDRYRMEIVDLRKQLDGQKHETQKEKDDEEEKAKEIEQEQRHEEQMLEMQLARTALKERIEHLNRLILSSKSVGVNAQRSYSTVDLGRRSGSQKSVAGRSARSTASAFDPAEAVRRTSEDSGKLFGQAGVEPAMPGGYQQGDDDEELEGENGDGTASLSLQVQTLQSDVADKNRYIATLEKRLLQARRNSRSRVSMTFSGSRTNSLTIPEDESSDDMLKEKDSEIADLRARLDDKDRMIAALKSAARKRDTADSRPSSITSSIAGSPTTTGSSITNGTSRRISGNTAIGGNVGGSKRHSINAAPSTPLSRVTSAAASDPPQQAPPPPHVSPPSKVIQLAGGSPAREVKRGHGVDEMTRLLDEMIRQKVQAGGGKLASKNSSQDMTTITLQAPPVGNTVENPVQANETRTVNGASESPVTPSNPTMSGPTNNRTSRRTTNGRITTDGRRLSGWEGDVSARRSTRSRDGTRDGRSQSLTSSAATTPTFPPSNFDQQSQGHQHVRSAETAGSIPLVRNANMNSPPRMVYATTPAIPDEWRQDVNRNINGDVRNANGERDSVDTVLRDEPSDQRPEARGLGIDAVGA
ncbi:MAG: hypothetical protein M1828_006569 [Chrysothrix sp. TS-e1954]|nr:MAG: hypothetical protein M1828_006569 [Chrysothrix sp. TS-e1954]